jgi:hypothetical protein
MDQIEKQKQSKKLSNQVVWLKTVNPIVKLSSNFIGEFLIENLACVKLPFTLQARSMLIFAKSHSKGPQSFRPYFILLPS